MNTPINWTKIETNLYSTTDDVTGEEYRIEKTSQGWSIYASPSGVSIIAERFKDLRLAKSAHGRYMADKRTREAMERRRVRYVEKYGKKEPAAQSEPSPVAETPEDSEPDYDAYIAQQEREHNDYLDQMEQERADRFSKGDFEDMSDYLDRIERPSSEPIEHPQWQEYLVELNATIFRLALPFKRISFRLSDVDLHFLMSNHGTHLDFEEPPNVLVVSLNEYREIIAKLTPYLLDWHGLDGKAQNDSLSAKQILEKMSGVHLTYPKPFVSRFETPQPTPDKLAAAAQVQALNVAIDYWHNRKSDWISNLCRQLFSREVSKVSQLTTSEASTLEMHLATIKRRAYAHVSQYADAHLHWDIYLKFTLYPDDWERAKATYAANIQTAAYKVTLGRTGDFKKLTDTEACEYSKVLERMLTELQARESAK